MKERTRLTYAGTRVVWSTNKFVITLFGLARTSPEIWHWLVDSICEACPATRAATGGSAGLTFSPAATTAPRPQGRVAIVDQLVDNNNQPLYSGVVLSIEPADSTLTLRTYLRQFVDANGGDFLRMYYQRRLGADNQEVPWRMP